MRAYEVLVTTVVASGETMTHLNYAGSMADAVKARQAFVDDLQVRKKDVALEEIDIPLSKADLLAWINEKVTLAGQPV